MRQFGKNCSVFLSLLIFILWTTVVLSKPVVQKLNINEVLARELSYFGNQDSISKCLLLLPDDDETEIPIIIGRKKDDNRFEYNAYHKKSANYNYSSHYDIPSGDSFEVRCLSRSPVTLQFNGILANKVLKTFTPRHSLGSGTPLEGRVCFEASVTLLSSKSSTGRYQCVNISPGGVAITNSSKNASSSSSIYIFAGGNEGPNLLYTGTKVITVDAESPEKPVILPCLTTNASVPVYLFKNGTQVLPIPPYNPMEGFTLSQFSCGDVFSCSVHKNSSVASLISKIRVDCPEKHDDSILEESLPELEFKVVKTSSEMEYRCLEATSMTFVECNNLLECEFLRSCGTRFAQLSPRVCNPTNSDECDGGNTTSGSGKCLAIRTAANDALRGLIFCSNDKKTLVKEIFSDIKGNKALSINYTTGTASPKRTPPYNKWISFIPMIYKTWENVGNFTLYESLPFQCNASRILAADGIELLFELKNGNRISANPTKKSIFQNGHIYSETSEISFNNSEISKVICRAPQLYSNGWHEISHDIVINPFVPLHLLDGNCETKFTKKISRVNALDDEHKLSCTATGTNVAISWKKNNLGVAGSHDVYNIKLNRTVWRSTIIIYYDPSGHRDKESEDMYSCTAESPILNQTQTKNIYIEWTEDLGESPGTDIPIEVVFSIICAILLICLIVMWVGSKYLKKHWENKALKKLEEAFINGIKNPDHQKNGLKNKCQNPKRGDPNYYRSMPYNPEFEILASDLIIEDAAGTGHFGEVFSGKLLKNGEIIDVAIKTLRDKDNLTEEQFLGLLGDFLDEIKFLQQLDEHENVVKFIGSVTADMRKTKKPKIVFELCLEDLQSFMKKVGDFDFIDEVHQNNSALSANYTPLEVISSPSPQSEGVSYSASNPRITTSHIFQWCYEIATGMEYLSSLGVIHRDLASRNILLTRELFAKIADFGLSKTLQQVDRQYYNANYFTSAYGEEIPVRWVAIEALEERKFSEDSDIWAFGVVMWELFNRCKFVPYDHIANDGSIVQNLIAELNSGKRLCKPSYANEAIYDVMLQCWAKEKSERPRFSELKKLIRQAEQAMSLNDNNNH